MNGHIPRIPRTTRLRLQYVIMAFVLCVIPDAANTLTKGGE